jgi:hypothetical protein
MRSAAAAMLGASLTGVGLVLFAAGILWSLYAQSLEDDDNEAFLRRTYWGDREEGTKPFGGGKPAGAVAIEKWAQEGLEAEMLALGNLALGFKGEITDWNGEWFADDIIEFRFTFGNWDPATHHFEYVLTGYTDKQRSAGPKELRRGSSHVELPQRDDEVFVLAIEQKVDDSIYQAVQLEFAYYKDGQRVGSDKLWATIDD